MTFSSSKCTQIHTNTNDEVRVEEVSQAPKRICHNQEPSIDLTKQVPSPRRTNQTRIKTLQIDLITAQQKEEYDESLGKFIFSSSDPASILEEPTFQSFIKVIRPGYKLPSLYELTTEILDRCYQKELARIAQNDAVPATLMIQDEKASLNYLAVPRFGLPIFVQNIKIPDDEQSFIEINEHSFKICENYKINVEACCAFDQGVLDKIANIPSRDKYLCYKNICEEFISQIQDNELFDEINSINDVFMKSSSLQSVLESYGGIIVNSDSR